MIIYLYIYIYYTYIYISCEYHIRHRTLFKNQKAFVQPSEGTPLPLALAAVSLLVGDSESTESRESASNDVFALFLEFPHVHHTELNGAGVFKGMLQL